MDSDRNLFNSQQLPPPSQLHLPSFSPSNTLPPIPHINPPSPSTPRFAPYHQRLPLHHQQLSQNQNDHLAWPGTSQLSSSSARDDPHVSMKPEISPMNTQHKDNSSTSHGSEDPMPSTSDFVKKLYKMLEDPAFQPVVSWGPQGDCFVVKDMNEFTKSILPRMFKHSNFASFVRQLNKYDFHKVKNTDDNQFGEHSWTFRHPDFHAHRRDALENIKRKVPAQRNKSIPTPTTTTSSIPLPSNSSTYPSRPLSPSNSPYQSQQIGHLQTEISRLKDESDDLRARLRTLERNYESVLVEMVGFQRGMAQQDGLMQSLIGYFLGNEGAKLKPTNPTSTNPQSTPSASVAASTSLHQHRQHHPQQPPSTQSTSSIPQIPSHHTTSDLNPFLPPLAAARMMGMDRSVMYPEADVGRATLMQMSELSRRAESLGPEFASGVAANPSSRFWGQGASGNNTIPDIFPSTQSGQGYNMSREETLARIEELQRVRAEGGGWASGLQSQQPESSQDQTDYRPDAGPNKNSWNNVGAGGDEESSSVMTHEGLQVYTVGHLMPRSCVDDTNGGWSFDARGLEGGPEEEEEVVQPSVPSTSGTSTSELSPPIPGGSQKLRVRRSTFVPGWAVPPRVLLVDDDAVSRKLSSKFLQVFGCTIDVAVDGVGAVNKMNLEKYDLVLMDIVMPKLDGVSATSMIRKFDPMTPIISMTSNSKPNEIMTYYSSGMNDILPKPFTKEGLLDMLEKHLMHLKVIQQMSRVPRQPESLSENQGGLNILAGMGISDEQYNVLLQNLVSGDSLNTGSEKRALEEASDGRDGKRSRFQVVS